MIDKARLLSALPPPLRELKPSRWWFFPPVLLGLIITVLAALLAPGAQRSTAPAAPLPVRVMIVAPQDVTPTLTAYGEIRPRQRWQAVAQVPGKIAWRHPALQVGATFPAGTRLLEIDLLDYEVAESRAQAQLSSALAAQTEVESRVADLTKTIEIEERALALAAKRYARNVELAEDGHLSQLQLDAEERELLGQQRALQNLHTEANQLPAQQRAAAARVAEARAALNKAQADLNRTVFDMPFDGRIVELATESDQFVPAGQPMLAAQSTRSVEVLLEAPYEHLVTRFPSVMADTTLMADPGELLTAEIRYRTTTGGLYWLGRVSRIDTGLNAASRSARLYVQVELDQDEIPPAANLYVEVQIAGPLLAEHVVIPRLAWHDGHVLVADVDNRLQRRAVTTAFAEDDVLVLATGLEAGERLILTDVLFPAEGMAVSPIVVDETAAL